MTHIRTLPLSEYLRSINVNRTWSKTETVTPKRRTSKYVKAVGAMELVTKTLHNVRVITCVNERGEVIASRSYPTTLTSGYMGVRKVQFAPLSRAK